jgi:hypothetical protein
LFSYLVFLHEHKSHTASDSLNLTQTFSIYL